MMAVDLPQSKDSMTSHRGNVLVVDDEPAFCDVVCEILQAIGYQAQYALNASEALRLLPHFIPDVILTDVMMPDMDGLSFIRHLRAQAQWRSTPIVIISAKSSTEDRHQALESGANDFLAKPFSAQDLEDLVERTLNHATP